MSLKNQVATAVSLIFFVAKGAYVATKRFVPTNKFKKVDDFILKFEIFIIQTALKESKHILVKIE